MSKTETKATRKRRSIDEQIAELEAKRAAQAKQKRDSLNRRYDEVLAKKDRAQVRADKYTAELNAIAQEINALDDGAAVEETA